MAGVWSSLKPLVVCRFPKNTGTTLNFSTYKVFAKTTHHEFLLTDVMTLRAQNDRLDISCLNFLLLD